MDLITIDTETFYSQDFSLTKVTTEEYIRSPLFEVIGLSVKRNNEGTQWASGTHEQLKEWLHAEFNWADSMVLAHNTMFDGAILNWIFGINPRVFLDTLCMGRALHGVEVGGSLKVMAERYGLGEKGTEIVNAKGKRRADFSEEELSRYGDYCINDVELTYKLFKILAKGFPKQELKLIDTTLRMFIEPTLDLNLPLLEAHLGDIQDRKHQLLENAGVTRDLLLSNPKFAELLRGLGVEPPMKESPTTGKQTLALAKNDEGFKALQEHEDDRVQALVAARLGTKSTLEETRTQRFIDIAKRGKLPVPVRYYAAHTGRWGGDDKINLQNLPSRGTNANKLKRSIVAPEGHYIIDADSAQIEARVLAWLAGQDDLTNVFNKNNAEILAGVDKKDFKYDPYKLMAATIYNKPEEDITSAERFVGKTTILGCFGADTKVLTDRGWKRIVEVQATDLLWDGEEWVNHQGVIPKGLKEVVTAYGVDATPEHEILTGHGWREWCEVTTNPSLFQSALRKASSPSSTGNNISNLSVNPQGGIRWLDALVGGKDSSIGITLKPNVLHVAIRALRGQVTALARSIGGTKILSRTWNTVNDCLTGSRVAFHDAIQPLANHTHIMGVEGSLSTNRGELTGVLSYDTSRHWIIGKKPIETLTESTTTKGTSPITYVLQRDPKTQKTNVRRVQCRKKLMTYDIAYAGPRNRFTIATDVGNLIVHNCGYGMGAVKFQAQLKAFGHDMDLDETRRIIHIYRDKNNEIVNLWREAQNVLVNMLSNIAAPLGREGILEVVPSKRAIKLPSGLLMRYDDLDFEQGEKGLEFNYKTRRGRTRIYGGKVVENVCQGIARCIIGEQMLKIASRYKVVLTVHDSVACVVPKSEVDEAVAYVESAMRWVPDWAQGLPLNCESGYAESYGDC